MDYQIKGKVALVTGAAGGGLGRADALALASEGVNLAVMDIQSCDETVKLIEAKGVKAKGYCCDISNEGQVKEAVAQIEKDLGVVEILVNNASILTTVGMFAEIDPKKFNRDVEVNLIGSANVTRAVWPHMLEKKWGRVISMSSIAGTRGGSGQASYSATKAAMVGFGKTLALEGGRFGITSNIIAPGVMKSEAAVTLIRPDMLERMEKKTALRRLGETEEIAALVTFLSSKQAGYITGQVIEVDGGMGLFTF
jgi:NAD(P)-dependent dehydrogenase (short-subunit alcohol dehydrogenase family)